MRAALATLTLLSLTVLGSLLLIEPRDAAQQTQESLLPKIAPTLEFTLTSQDGVPVSLKNLRGKVVAVTFIFTMCSATCPVLTPMMSFARRRERVAPRHWQTQKIGTTP